MSDVENGQSIESEAKAIALGQTDAELWMKKINKQKANEKDWRTASEASVKVYEADDESLSFNIFHSNVETIHSTVYNSTPIPDVRRQFGQKNPVDKLIADICERFLTESLDSYDIDDEMKATIIDGEVTGRGVARIRYNPTLEQQQIVRQDVETERVQWDKVVVGPSSCWRKVPWLAFPLELEKEEVLSLVSEKADPKVHDWAKALGLDTNSDKSEEGKGIVQTVKVWEIWCKRKREVIFIAEQNQDFPLSVRPDPLKLKNFFPCPKPYQPIRRLSSTIPLNPYKVYKGLTAELDKNSKRINKLIGQLKVRGIYDAEIAAEMKQLETAGDGEYLPAENAIKFAQQGLDKAISHFPLDPQVKALQELYKQRELIKQTIYEVTGISDIIRGSSNPNETLGAQQIKKQQGNLRIASRQKEAERIGREIMRMKCEIMGKHFTDEQIMLKTLLPDTDEDKQLWAQAMGIIKEGLHGYRVDIETNSTIRADQTHAQEQMNNFLTGTGNFAGAMAGVVQLHPKVLPAIIEIYTAFARKFQLGKQAEDALDQLSQAGPEVAEKVEQDQGGGEDPAAAAKAEQEAAAQQEQAKAQATQQAKEQEMSAKVQIEKAKAEAAAQADMARTASAERMKAAELLINTLLKRMEIAAAANDAEQEAEAGNQLAQTMQELQAMVQANDNQVSVLTNVVNDIVEEIGGQAPPQAPPQAAE